ncbi:MAG: hypothetical protein C5B49_11785 [Bdellovibrio sp.]|nr:MAG: hypothetical protein C5B49_11785 [Bdellovibrio sp.]
MNKESDETMNKTTSETTKVDVLRIAVERAGQLESEHLVDALVLDRSGQTLMSFGQIDRQVAPRSAIKPFQALLLANSKWAELDHRAETRLALACSSHSGSVSHLNILREWLREMKVLGHELACGAHWPRDNNERNHLIREHRNPEKLHNNCSGKHMGLIALCRDRGYAVNGYHKFTHPVQQEIRQLLSELGGENWEAAPWGIDGCGIPTQFVSLAALARLGLLFFDESSRFFRGVERIRRAMTRHPQLVSGEGEFNSWLIKESGGKILAKGGAEGNYWGASFITGMTFFLKVRDGASRAAEAAVLEILRRNGDIEDSWKASFEKMAQWPLKNWSGEVIGRIRVE